MHPPTASAKINRVRISIRRLGDDGEELLIVDIVDRHMNHAAVDYLRNSRKFRGHYTKFRFCFGPRLARPSVLLIRCSGPLIQPALGSGRPVPRHLA